ncbi:MAG: ATP-binding protein, partial [Crocinitomicaceae bacterium]|nr:ATP-binding protein [Crocinitomicaceae bacterium]
MLSAVEAHSHLKYIITGIPGSGKTTLIDALQKHGHPVMHEVSRSVIQNEQYEQRDGVPWQNIERFTALVFKETQRRLQENKAAIFCDRGLIDNMAYLEAAGKHVPNYLKLFPFEQFYHKCVFFAPPWEAIYVNDPQRPEAFHKQQKLNQTLIKV